METDAADGSIGLEVGSLVPEKEPSRHGGSGDTEGGLGATATTTSGLVPACVLWSGINGASRGGTGGGGVGGTKAKPR